jgi:2-oxoglutarate/2-oxoacid ferredoxin oxidoreductase subunit alpha
MASNGKVARSIHPADGCQRLLLTGNVATAEGAIRAGCRHYFGYPITPQNDIPEYMSGRMPEVGGTFIQAESELAAISMVHGAAAAGAMAMTSSSSPGVSLKQEGLSYMAGSQLPCLIVNVQRGGPGLGDVRCAQGDYFQATRGGGHGDYYHPVLAPHTVQESYDLARHGMLMAMNYRTPVMILSDQQLGQMMEPVELTELQPPPTQWPDWALTGAADGRPRRYVHSYCGKPGELVALNRELIDKCERMKAELTRCETVQADDAELLLVAYGTSARLCKATVARCRAEGLKVGLLRPITLWPFPTEALAELARRVRKMLVVEMSWGQLIEDVRLAVNGRVEVGLENTFGGDVPKIGSIVQRVRRELRGRECP